MQREVIARGVLAEPPFRVPQVIVSDLHLNSSGGQDNCQQILLRQYLAWLPPAFQVTVAGDGLDLAEEPNYWRIFQNCAATLNALYLRNVLFIVGNHDYCLARWPLKQCYFPDELDTRCAFIAHGDKLDPACSGAATVLMRVAAFAWGLLERLGLGPRLQSWKGRIEDWYRRRRGLRARTASKTGEGNDRQIAEAIKRNKPLVAGGHTHVAQLVPLGNGRWYGNAGCWVQPGVGYAIEVEGVDIALVRITG